MIDYEQEIIHGDDWAGVGFHELTTAVMAFAVMVFEIHFWYVRLLKSSANGS